MLPILEAKGEQYFLGSVQFYTRDRDDLDRSVGDLHLRFTGSVADRRKGVSGCRRNVVLLDFLTAVWAGELFEADLLGERLSLQYYRRSGGSVTGFRVGFCREHFTAFARRQHRRDKLGLGLRHNFAASEPSSHLEDNL